MPVGIVAVHDPSSVLVIITVFVTVTVVSAEKIPATGVISITPTVVGVKIEIVAKPDITVIVAQSAHTQGYKSRSGNPFEIVTMHKIVESVYRNDKCSTTHQYEINITSRMAEIVYLSRIAVHVISGIAVLEFIVCIGIVIVFHIIIIIFMFAIYESYAQKQCY
jgi:hypothetical protein